MKHVMAMMKRVGAGLAAAVAVVMMSAGPAMAQANFASVHGKVLNTAGMSMKGASVQFTKNLTGEMKDRVWQYKFATDANGDFVGKGLLPGEYSCVVFADGKSLDIIDSVKLEPNEDKLIGFDMSRKEYIDKLTPEEKTALAEYKKKTGETINANKVIANLNTTLTTVRADLAAALPTKGDVSKDIDSMKQATVAKPDEGLLWMTLGDVQQAQGDHLAKADRDQHKSPVSDPDVQTQYGDAIDSLQKGVALNLASKKPNANDAAVAYNQIGNTYGKMGKTDEAAVAFDNAVKTLPANAGMYYANEAAILFNAGMSDKAAEAADKAIAADPTKADPYFIRGQSLIAKATVDKAGKIVAPPGCVEAYQKYLELAPDGKSAATVREILASMGQTVNTKYKAPGKK